MFLNISSCMWGEQQATTTRSSFCFLMESLMIWRPGLEQRKSVTLATETSALSLMASLTLSQSTVPEMFPPHLQMKTPIISSIHLLEQLRDANRVDVEPELLGIYPQCQPEELRIVENGNLVIFA